MPNDEDDRRRRGKSLMNDLFGPGSAFEGIFEEGGTLDQFLGEADTRRKERETAGKINYKTEYANLASMIRSAAGVDADSLLGDAFNKLSSRKALLRRILREIGINPDTAQAMFADQVFDEFQRRLAPMRQAHEGDEHDAVALVEAQATIDALRANQRDIAEVLNLAYPGSITGLEVRNGAAEVKAQVGRHEHMWGLMRDAFGAPPETSAYAMHSRAKELMAQVAAVRAGNHSFTKEIITEALRPAVDEVSRHEREHVLRDVVAQVELLLHDVVRREDIEAPAEPRKFWTELREALDLPEDTKPHVIVETVRERLAQAQQDRALIQEHGNAVPHLSYVAGEYREALESIERSLGWDPEDSTNGPREVAEEVQAYVDGYDAMKARVLDAEDKLRALGNRQDVEGVPHVKLGAGDIIRAVDHGALGLDPHIAVSYDLTTGRWVFDMLDEAGPAGSNERAEMRRERDAAFELVQSRPNALAPVRSLAEVVEEANGANRSAHTFGIVDLSEKSGTAPETSVKNVTSDDNRLDRLLALLALESQREGNPALTKRLRDILGDEEG